MGIADLAAFFVVALRRRRRLPVLAASASSPVLCIALLGAWEARNQAEAARASWPRPPRRALRSEESSRLQAHQQSEVARFGQLALEGADIDELTRGGEPDPDRASSTSTSAAC